MVARDKRWTHWHRTLFPSIMFQLPSPPTLYDANKPFSDIYSLFSITAAATEIVIMLVHVVIRWANLISQSIRTKSSIRSRLLIRSCHLIPVSQSITSNVSVGTTPLLSCVSSSEQVNIDRLRVVIKYSCSKLSSTGILFLRQCTELQVQKWSNID